MTIRELVNRSMKDVKEELMRTVKEQDFLLEERDALKMLSEAEELEDYNRRG